MNQIGKLGRLFKGAPKTTPSASPAEISPEIIQKVKEQDKQDSAAPVGLPSSNIEPGKNRFLRNEKFGNYIKEGPVVWITKILHEKGTLTSRQIWNEYKKDQEAQEKLKIQSITMLKHKILAEMKINQQIFNTREDLKGAKNKTTKGYKLNYQKVLKNMHPQVVVELGVNAPRIEQSDVKYWLQNKQ